MQDCDTFINHIADNFDDVKNKVMMLCGRNRQRFDEDAFQNAILKCYNAIKKKGKLKDTSPYGIESYLIKSYLNQVIDDKRGCHYKLRDANIDSDSINNLYEDYYNANYDSARNKIASDLLKDFSTIFILTKVEQQFDSEHFYLFRLKYLCGYTYKQVCQKANVTGCRMKIIEVKKWIQENITRDDIKEAFSKEFGEIL